MRTESPTASAPDPLRAALERIAAIAPKPFQCHGSAAFTCRHCQDEWYEGNPESHESWCAYVIARAALAAQPKQE